MHKHLSICKIFLNILFNPKKILKYWAHYITPLFALQLHDSRSLQFCILNIWRFLRKKGGYDQCSKWVILNKIYIKEVQTILLNLEQKGYKSRILLSITMFRKLCCSGQIKPNFKYKKNSHFSLLLWFFIYYSYLSQHRYSPPYIAEKAPSSSSQNISP